MNGTLFLLNPDLPDNGLGWMDFLQHRFGDIKRVKHILETITRTAKANGIDMCFNRISRMPNTMDAHRLVRLSDDQNQKIRLIEALFKGYFCDGLDTGDIETLVQIGTKCGLVEHDIRTRLGGNDDIEEIIEESLWCQEVGINGVPAYIFDHKTLISGVQETAVFQKMVETTKGLSDATPNPHKTASMHACSGLGLCQKS